jgi:predicted dehydrogenase
MATNGKKISRRRFVQGAGAGVALFTIVPRHVLGGPGKKAPSDKINIAGIGVGGQGGSDIRAVGGENIVALCDVDDRRAADTYKRFAKAKRFRDFRKMLDEVHKEIDAVVVGTPDHTHAVACMAALKRGKHVFCEKPLAHSIHEVRQVMKAARESKVVTQLGNQGHSSERIRRLCEWVWDGAIGKVTEVHAACDAFRNVYCQINKLPQLKQRPKVPKELDWDLWLGPVQERPYQPFYVPWNWRGWLPFGTGTIGDWVCHVVDPAFWALDLGAPRTVQAEVEGYDPKKHADVYPPGTKVTYEFAAKGKRGPVTLYWYDGNKRIPRPKELEKGRNAPGTGAILIGTDGAIMHGSHGAGGARIIPDSKMRDYKQPARSIPRVRGHHGDWLESIRKGRQASSNFDYGGPLTELALLGVIAVHLAGQKLEWDGEKMRFTNCPEANQYVKPPFRQGWTL